MMSTIPNIQPASAVDLLLKHNNGTVNGSNEQSSPLEEFETLIARAAASPSNESAPLKGKNQQPQAPVQNAEIPAVSSNKISEHTVSGTLVESKHVQASSKTPAKKSPEVQDPAQAAMVSIPNIEILAEQMLAATIPTANPIDKALPTPSQLGTAIKPQTVSTITKAKTIPSAAGKVSTSDLSENQAPAGGQSSPVTKPNSLTAKEAELSAKDSEVSIPVNPATLGLSKVKSDSEPDDPSSKDSDSSTGTAASSAPDFNGTSIAKQDTAMNQAEKTNKIAEQTEKVLPSSPVSGMQANSSLYSPHAEQFTATVAAGSSAPGNTDAVATLPASSAVVVVPTPDSRILERTQDMVTLNATRLSDSGNNSMQVVIKPDAGTQLSLELRQHSGGVEVQAVLQQGNFNHLSQQWPDLQQKLDQRGIRLAPLTDDAASANNGGNETFQQKQNQSTEVPAIAFVDAPTGMFVPQVAQASSSRNWETWA
jgi:hypothetical protein